VKIFEDAEVYLGSSDGRFFGSGYKKVSYSITDESFGEGKYSGEVNIQYQDDWSLKKKKLKPHLSSIDTMILASHACNLIINSGSERDYRISSLIVRASTTPLECLSTIPVSFQNQNEEPEGIKIQGEVGNMQVIATYKKNENEQENFSFVDNNFRNNSQNIKNIELNSIDDSLSKLYKTTNGESDQNLDFIDVFVSSLQVGQIMLYELDGIKREDSNNLWMRNFKLEKREKLHQENTLSVTLANMTITQVEGNQWRSADIVANVNNLSLRCSVAHQLSLRLEK
jgi:hypothetical protein